MKKNTLSFVLISSLAMFAITACVKDSSPAKAPTPFPVAPAPVNFMEEFDSVGNLTAKGWIFRNNSTPVGQTGWRQGRYEPMPLSTPIGKKGGFSGPVTILGFPAYSAKNSPQDFISVDITAMADPTGAGGNLSAWLISPQMQMKNGDTISFFTRAIDDQYYPAPLKDRLQLWLNKKDGSANVGMSFSDSGSFSSTILDINKTYAYNNSGGYPLTWRKYTYIVSGLAASGVSNGRFAFRYFGLDAGFNGGSTADNFPGMIGIDQLRYSQKK